MQFGLIPKEEESSQVIKDELKKESKKKNYEKSFYVLDTETSGFKHNEPIQIAVLLYIDGVESGRYNHFYMPDGRITKSAFKTHGKNKDVLRKLQAEKFTKDACE